MIAERLAAAALALALPAAAQVPEERCETPEDVVARVHFERAVRAELEGRPDDAVREAQAAIDAGEQTRFAEAARKLAQRVRTQAPATAQPASTGVGSRTELVVTSTLAGLYLSTLLAATAKPDGKGAVAILMLGTGVGLAGSIVATSGRHLPQSMPQMVENGMYYGTFAGLMVGQLADARSEDAPTSMLLGASAGVLAGFASAPFLTGGDSGAATTGFIYGAAMPVLLYTTIERNPDKHTAAGLALATGSAGMLAAILYNHQAAHFSRGRWNLITLGGAVGALMGVGVGVLADAWQDDTRKGLGLLTAGTAAGLGLTFWLTEGFGTDEPHPGATSLLHFEAGKAALGNALTAVVPVERGAYLRAVEARF